MNCQKARRLLPLAAGSEIPQSKVSIVKDHLEKCQKCRNEYDAYLLSLEKIKEWLAEDKKDWKEREWQEAVKRAIGEAEPKVSALAPWPFKKVWAYALMTIFAVALSLFVIRPSFFKEKAEPGSRILAEARLQPGQSFREKSQQEVISLTLISKETGLRIVWFFNKNFELEVR